MSSRSPEGKIRNMEVVEDFESRPHKTVFVEVERDKEFQVSRERQLPKARCFTWSCPKKKIQVEAKWHEGIFFGIKNESEEAVVGTPHGISSKRGFWRWHVVQQCQWCPMGLATWNRKRYRVQSAAGCQSCRSGSTSSTADNRGAVAKKSLHLAIRGTGTRTSVSGV